MEEEEVGGMSRENGRMVCLVVNETRVATTMMICFDGRSSNDVISMVLSGSCSNGGGSDAIPLSGGPGSDPLGGVSVGKPSSMFIPMSSVII